MDRPRFSEETILSVSKTKLATARKHVPVLADFGITEEFVNRFETDINAAEALPGETQNRIELRGLTADKDEVLDACVLWGGKLRLRLELAFGRRSSQYNAFPSAEFGTAQKSENTMMNVIEILLALAGKYQAELAEHGQTPEFLTEGTNLLNELRAADLAQEEQKEEKQMATRERYQIFSKLYKTVNRINRVGRLVYRGDPVNLSQFESPWPRSSSSNIEETEQPPEA